MQASLTPSPPTIGTVVDDDGLRRRIDVPRASRVAPLRGMLALAPFSLDGRGERHRPVRTRGWYELSGIGHGLARPQVAWALTLCTDIGAPAMTLTGTSTPECLQHSMRSAIARWVGGIELTGHNSVLVQVLPTQAAEHPFCSAALRHLHDGQAISLVPHPHPFDLDPGSHEAAVALQLLDIPVEPGSLVAYTDGSWLGAGRDGGAAMVTTDGQWVAGATTKARSPFDCEVEAARMAVRVAPSRAALTIRTDCRQLVMQLSSAIEAGSPLCGSRPMNQLVKAIECREGPVRAEWVKGHSGVRLNEAADRMARLVARHRRHQIPQDATLAVLTAVLDEHPPAAAA